MKFGEIKRFITGTAIPVFSLRTVDSCGAGEFLDLIKLGQWCRKVSLDLIQILPVNDTGDEASPYYTRSAFALNPVYLRLQEIDGMEIFNSEIDKTRAKLNSKLRGNYIEVYNFKLTILRKYYALYKNKIKKNEDLHTWISENPWLEVYCVYSVLKDINNQRPWFEWNDLTDPTPSIISNYWEEHKEEVLFFAWVQFELEKQLKKASNSLNKKWLRLKGDIPILVNKDSADVWGERKIFDTTMQAGAPPDMFSETGQNWSFPCYNWSQIEKDKFLWWKNRLKHAGKFYHACRIDHVLGFFRIWQIPQDELSGVLGRFNPAVSITKAELEKSGLDGKRIYKYLFPHFDEAYLNEYFGYDADRMKKSYFKTTTNGLFVFSKNIKGERAIQSLDEDPSLKEKLRQLYWDRILLPSPLDKNSYLPSWYFYKTHTFNNLSEEERTRLREIVDNNWSLQDDLWRKNGLKLLRIMRDATDMLVCAEDLGAVPACVPEVLEELGILGLRIERWAREYDKDYAPYIDTVDYPRLTVCSPSGHDTSTLRGWWEEDNWDRNQYYSLLQMPGESPGYLTTELSEKIIKRNLNANSNLCIFAIQDLLGLYYNLRTDYPDEERINVPGKTSPTNWSYRMKDNIELLLRYDEYNNYLRGLIEERRNKPLHNQ